MADTLEPERELELSPAVESASASTSASVDKVNVIQNVLVFSLRPDPESESESVTLDYVFPELTQQLQNQQQLQVPDEWNAIPAFLLQQTINSDFDEVISDFELPGLTPKTTTDPYFPILYAVSCICLKVDSDANDKALGIKKAVVVLSTEVLPELARTKISIVARAFTDAGSSSGFAAIENLHSSLNKNIKALFTASADLDSENLAPTSPLDNVEAFALQGLKSIVDSFDAAGKALTDPRIGEGFSKVVEEAGEGITKVMGTAEAHLGQALNSAEEGITKVLEDINVSEGIKQIQETASSVFTSVSSWFTAPSPSVGSWGIGDWGAPSADKNTILDESPTGYVVQEEIPQAIAEPSTKTVAATSAVDGISAYGDDYGKL